MSVWKKASKVNQKTHRERHQPEERKHLGLLEKHKDYKKRAVDYSNKRETLKLLHKRALNKNPDEFYYHMINSKLNEGKHHENEKISKDTPEQVQLMKTKDLRYVVMKQTHEFKKIERLQSQLHLISVNSRVQNKHIHFKKNLEKDALSSNLDDSVLAKYKLPDVDINTLTEAAKKCKHMYSELSKRIKREKELSVVQQKIRVKKNLEDKNMLLKPKRLKKGNKFSAPVYQWKYERKK